MDKVDKPSAHMTAYTSVASAGLGKPFVSCFNRSPFCAREINDYLGVILIWRGNKVCSQLSEDVWCSNRR